MPYFLVQNKLRDATITSEDTITNFEIANGIDGNTSTQVGFATGASRSVVFDFTTATNITHLAFAGHNITGATITVEYSANGGSFGTAYNAIGLEGVQMRAFANDSLSFRYWRVTISGHSVDAYISDLFLGNAITLPYGMPVGFTPPEFADEDRVESSVTGNGSIVGITVTERPKRISIQMDDYEVSWFNTNWLTLTSSLKQYAGYFLWDDAGEAFFGTLSRKADKPKYTSHTRMSAKLDLEGFV